jgi:Mn2+/Fe2+ NRAMP family transporter
MEVTMNTRSAAPPNDSAALDAAHTGDIRGAFGTIPKDDVAPRRRLSRRLMTLLAILGPGLIVMVGDNDAGAFGTYTQAGQNYGTDLLWTLLLLFPVLYVNQEMVVRLGIVSGVGHARLILERFGKFWGAFSVIDLFALNALTIVTEFIGLSLVLIPVYLMIHSPIGQVARNFFVPGLPGGAKLSDVMLLIIAIVGTTVAPWQLFFQQSYVIDKRITPRFMRYEKADLTVGIGIVIVIVSAAAMMGFSAATFAGHPEFGNFTDAGGTAIGLGNYVSHLIAAALLLTKLVQLGFGS